MNQIAVSILVALAVASNVVSADDSVVGSPHDLSTHSRSSIRALHETRICIFCHAPHNNQPETPLWNRENPTTHYRIYESSTTQARIDQPSGPSKMCLSCHDGSMALGMLLSRPMAEPVVMTSRTIPPGPSDLTGDLSDDHPIGFRYDRALSNQDAQIRPPEVVTVDLPLGAHGEMHCTTCHDPHDNELGDFLRVTNRMSAICISCHDMTGWPHGAHAVSRARVTGRKVDPLEQLLYTTVADNACTSCHKVHSAPQRERLLRHKREEDNCLNCHDGSIARTNIASEIGKRSAHDVQRYTGVHDPAESLFLLDRHVECVDCHNPHAARASGFREVADGGGVRVRGPNDEVSGRSIHGADVEKATYLYEICFKCHADGVLQERPTVARQIQQTNTRLEFQPNNPSFHPVAGARRNADVVSLIPPLRAGSLISCIDCHNSEDSPEAGGVGPNGPHGSIYEPLLVANYQTQDFTTETAEAYALCYKCHSRQSILGDESFAFHRLHVVEQRASCATCHDPHGISRTEDNATNHSSLINFDLSVVSTAMGRIAFEDTGRLSGNCTLTCHGSVHVRFPYSRFSVIGASTRNATRTQRR